MSTAEVQAKVGAPPSGRWDVATDSAVRQYQALNSLAVTGHPDPITLHSLDLIDPYAGLSRKQQDYLDGGKEPGHFGRDFSGAMNQIPRWAWLTLGGAFGFMGWFAWYRRGRG
jgi:hypothetical protein